MGLLMSLMGRGLPPTQVFNILMETLYRQFTETEINNFGDFHMAILEIFNVVNTALPGKHYDVPPRREVQVCFDKWKEAKQSERKKVFIEFMKKNVNLGNLDTTAIITGLVTPPAAMAAKRAGESVPQLRMIKAIPDVVFVPTATIFAIVSVKLSRRIFRGNVGS